MDIKKLIKDKYFLRKLGMAALTLGVIPLCLAFSGDKRSSIEVTPTPIEISAEEQADFAKVDEALQTIKKRLELTHQLSHYNWDHKVAIDQPEKELKTLQSLSQVCAEKGVDLVLAEEIFQAQIEADKIVQIQDFEKWVIENKAITAHVDGAGLQEKIDGLNEKLALQIADLVPVMQKRNLGPLLDLRAQKIFGESISFSAKERAIAPLLSLYKNI